MTTTIKTLHYSNDYDQPSEDLNFLDRDREFSYNNTTAQNSTTTRSSPAKERAISILEERRQRFRNFRQTHDKKEYISTKNHKTHPSQCKITPRILTPTRRSNQDYGASPVVHFREDELTLLETTSKKSNDP